MAHSDDTSAGPGEAGAIAVAQARLAELAAAIGCGAGQRGRRVVPAGCVLARHRGADVGYPQRQRLAAIAGMLGRCQAQIRAHSIRVCAAWPPRRQSRADRDVIEVLFEFTTGDGEGEGVVRLIETGGRPRAWTMLTTLKSLHDRPERRGARRPRQPRFRGPFRRAELAGPQAG